MRRDHPSSGATFRRLLSAVFAMTVAAVTACLGPVPDPAVCPAPAQYNFCTLVPASLLDDGGFDPDSGFPGVSDGAIIDPGPGLSDDGGSIPCACSGDCARAACGGTACYPAPDCPPAVRGAFSTAACGQLGVPEPDPNPSGLTCACGADTCALACDGAGIVLGPAQTFSAQTSGSGQPLILVLPRDLPSSATLRAMVRMRGSGVLTLSVGSSDTDAGSSLQQGTGMPGLGTFDLPNETREFEDKINLDPSSSYTWTSSSDRPDLLFVSTDGSSNIEIDCIVPFYVQ